MSDRAVIGGLFVGGGSRRMGSDKGLLTRDGERLVDRGLRVLRAVCDEVVLVGRREAYADLDALQLEDSPDARGPLAGMIALLEYAAPRRALVLAVDMPFVEVAHLELLLAQPGSAAPRRDERWEPLCAAYSGEALELAKQRATASRYSLQGLLDALEPRLVTLPDAALFDWDTPADLEQR